MGTRLPFCIRRGAIFYWRRRLPSPSKMSVEFSLGTKDERVARRLTDPLGRQAGLLGDGRDLRSLQVCRSGSQSSKERRSEPEVDAEEVRPHSPTPASSKLGQAPQAPADKSGVKSASGPHPQNVRDSASGALSMFLGQH